MKEIHIHNARQPYPTRHNMNIVCYIKFLDVIRSYECAYTLGNKRGDVLNRFHIEFNGKHRLA